MFGDRKKLLLLGLLATFLGARVYGLSTGYIRARIEADAKLLADLELQLRSRERAHEKEVQARQGLESEAGRCLASDSPALTIQLQNWLIEEAENYGLDDVVVTPVPIQSTGDKLRELPFKVTAVGEFNSMIDLVERISHVPLAQRIDTIHFRSTGDAYMDQLELDFNVCFLMLPEDLSIPGLDPDSVAEKLGQSVSYSSPFADLVSLFRAEASPAKPAEVPTPVETVVIYEEEEELPIDRSGDFIQLGTLISAGCREVWVKDLVTLEQQILSEGQSFDLGGVSGIVETVAADGVTLEIEGRQYVWAVASTIKERVLARSR